MTSINVSTDQHAARHAPGGADPINMGLLQDGTVAGFVNTPGSATRTATDAIYAPATGSSTYQTQAGLDAATAGEVNTSGSATDTALKAKYGISAVGYGLATGATAAVNTNAINAAITNNPGRTILIPAGTYSIDPTLNSGVGTPVAIKLNQAATKLLLEPGAVLQSTTNSLSNYAMVQVTAADCRIEGGTFKGDVATHGTPVVAPTITLGATATSGGTFGAGTFYWKVTATTNWGETTGSNEVTATLVATGTQVLNWAAVGSAAGYKVYRGTTAGAENVLVATLGNVTTYTDTGTAGSAATIPATNGAFTGEWGHCIDINAGADRFKVVGTTALNAFGDGFIVQGTPNDVEIHNVTSDSNRRQGLSVVSVQGLRVFGGRFRNTGSILYTAPGAGIDIEPNVGTDVCADVEFHGVTVTGNKGYGVQVIAINAATVEQGKAKFFGGRIAQNQQSGIYIPDMGSTATPDGVWIEGVTVEQNTLQGVLVYGNVNNLRIVGGRYLKNGQQGILVFPNTGRTAANVMILGAIVKDNGQTTANTYDGIRADGAVNEFKVAFTRSGGLSQRYGITTGSSVTGELYCGNDMSGNTTSGWAYSGAQSSRVRIEDGLVYSNALQSAANAVIGTTLQVGSTLTHLGAQAGFYGKTPVNQAAAITTPNTQTASYVQADVASLKTAIDAIRVALQNVGITA